MNVVIEPKVFFTYLNYALIAEFGRISSLEVKFGVITKPLMRNHGCVFRSCHLPLTSLCSYSSSSTGCRNGRICGVWVMMTWVVSQLSSLPACESDKLLNILMLWILDL